MTSVKTNHYLSNVDLSSTPLNILDVNYIQLYANGLPHDEIQSRLGIKYNRMKKALVKMRDQGNFSSAWGYTYLIYYCYTQGLIV